MEQKFQRYGKISDEAGNISGNGWNDIPPETIERIGLARILEAKK